MSGSHGWNAERSGATSEASVHLVAHPVGRASFRLALLAVRRIVLSCGLFVPGNCVLCAEHNSQYSLLSTMWPASFRQLG
jgi:hypothetical protein